MFTWAACNSAIPSLISAWEETLIILATCGKKVRRKQETKKGKKATDKRQQERKERLWDLDKSALSPPHYDVDVGLLPLIKWRSHHLDQIRYRERYRHQEQHQHHQEEHQLRMDYLVSLFGTKGEVSNKCLPSPPQLLSLLRELVALPFKFLSRRPRWHWSNLQTRSCPDLSFVLQFYPN